MVDGGALLLGQMRSAAVEGTRHAGGVEAEISPAGELGSRVEEAGFSGKVLVRREASLTISGAAEVHHALRLEGAVQQAGAVPLVERRALKVGSGKGGAGRGYLVDHGGGTLLEGAAGKRGDSAAGGRADLRRLRIPLAVLAESLAEAPGELGAAQGALDVGEGGAPRPVSHHETGAALCGLDPDTMAGELLFEISPARRPGERGACLLPHLVGERLASGAPGLLVGRNRDLGQREVPSTRAP